MLDAAPQALDKDIVKRSAASVHADGDALALQYAASMLLLILQLSTRREYQSMMATR